MLMIYKRSLKDLEKIKKNGYKVFSCFSCWGGSSMGYKNAGYEVIGTCEIDPEMDRIYQANLGKGYNYLMGVQDFKNIPKYDIPSELFNLDILDGSPPCSTFSTAWLREKARGKEKKFREGQAKQVLSDLFFDYLDVVEKLQPKVVVAENVSGMLKGNAKGYLKLIFQRFDELGYDVQLFLLNGATMGLPQRRERVFFVAHSRKYKLPKLKLDFNEKPILFKDIKYSKLNNRPLSWKALLLTKYAKFWDKDLSNACKRYEGKDNFFTFSRIYPEKVCNTIIWNDANIVRGENRHLNTVELKLAGSFPLDYNFQDIKPNYLIGMSVPPLMMYKVSNEIKKQRLDLIYNSQENDRL